MSAVGTSTAAASERVYQERSPRDEKRSRSIMSAPHHFQVWRFGVALALLSRHAGFRSQRATGSFRALTARQSRAQLRLRSQSGLLDLDVAEQALDAIRIDEPGAQVLCGL